jgi:predicted glutamine amidotransferase
MCRFALYFGKEITLGSLVTEPENSIIHQSYRSREQEEPLNGDGFGLAWYAPDITPEPAVFKDVTPAWNNLNLLSLAHVTKSSCILAHVRAATPGLPVVRLNCHPFVWGPFAFMHNGRVEGFQKIRRSLLRNISDEAFDLIKGSTDSEHLFALFVHCFQQEKEQGLGAMKRALNRSIMLVEEVRESNGISGPSFLNLAVTDGKRAVVSRYVSDDKLKPHSLYFWTGSRYECRSGIGHTVDAKPDGRATIIVSEPLTDDGRWTEVAPNSLLTVESDRTVGGQTCIKRRSN